MSRGGSYGGGQSSLGYLFSSDEPPPTPPRTAVITTITTPPYGIDTIDDQSSKKPNGSNNYLRAQGQNTGNFLTDRPSTKVNSVPGGDSSLGYLFGDDNKSSEA